MSEKFWEKMKPKEFRDKWKKVIHDANKIKVVDDDGKPVGPIEVYFIIMERKRLERTKEFIKISLLSNQKLWIP